jgi:hypothetical protein
MLNDASKSSVVIDRDQIRTRALSPPAPAYDAHSALGHRARMTCGLVTAATDGIRSIREECAPPAFINGLRRNAFRVADGRCIRSGMWPDTRGASV